MTHVLDIVVRQLRPAIVRAGFSLEGNGTDNANGIRLLEYCGSRSSHQRSLRLDFCQLIASQTIVAELWSPADLASMAAEAVENVAIFRRVWHYEEGVISESLVQEIVAEISVWLESSRCDGSLRLSQTGE